MATKKKPTRSTTSSKRTARRDRRDRGQRKDGWTNDYTGHGTTRDRRSYTGYSTDVVSDLEAIQMWRSDDLIARIVEMLPREAMRRGIELKVAAEKGKGKEVAEKVLAECERLNVNEKVKLAGQWERAYGGSAIFPIIDGATGELEEPLERTTSIVRIKALHLLEPRELRPASWYTDINHPKFRQPETYRLWPLAGASGTSTASEVIHETRLIVFPGIRVSNQLQAGQRPGWGDSVLSRCRQVVADFGLAWGSAATLLHDFARGVIKLKDLASMMQDTNGEAQLAKRLRAMDMAASTLRALTIDAEDDYTRTSTPISGMDGMLIQLAQRLAAAADMPVTFLMGMSPAGMNATGDADIRSWYDRVEALRAYYRDNVERLLRLIMFQTDGPLGGKEPDAWSMEWPALWQPSEKEEADRRNVVMQTDKGYFEMGAITAEQIARARWGGDTYSADLHIDWDELDKQKELAANPEQLSPEDLAAMGHAPGAPAPAPEVTPEQLEVEAAAELQAALMSKSGAILEVVRDVVAEKIPRESGKFTLMLCFALTAEQAEGILGPVNFEAAAAARPPPMFGQPPNAPPAPAEGEKPVPGVDDDEEHDEEHDDEHAEDHAEDHEEPTDVDDPEDDPEDEDEDKEK